MLLFDHLRLQEMDLAPEVVREISESAPKCLNERQVVRQKAEKVRTGGRTVAMGGVVCCSANELSSGMFAGVVERVQKSAAARSLQVALARGKGASDGW